MEATDSTDSGIDEDDEYHDSLTGVESFRDTVIDGKNPIDFMHETVVNSFVMLLFCRSPYNGVPEGWGTFNCALPMASCAASWMNGSDSDSVSSPAFMVHGM